MQIVKRHNFLMLKHDRSGFSLFTDLPLISVNCISLSIISIGLQSDSNQKAFFNKLFFYLLLFAKCFRDVKITFMYYVCRYDCTWLLFEPFYGGQSGSSVVPPARSLQLWMLPEYKQTYARYSTNTDVAKRRVILFLAFLCCLYNYTDKDHILWHLHICHTLWQPASAGDTMCSLEHLFYIPYSMLQQNV